MFKRIALILLALVVAWMLWEWITFPDVAALAKAPPKTTAFMELRKEKLRSEGKDDSLEWRWVPYNRISPYLRRAVLVAEDDAFYQHEGVDTKAMRDAFERNWNRGKVTHGGSTITQQLAKNLYLSPSRNPIRKLREYFIARSLERNLTKKRILEIYLNVVELGERVYGAEAGARHYFKKSASALSTREAALLAGCLPNPRVMNPGNPNRRLRSRQTMILSRMRRWGYLFERQVLSEKKPEPAATVTAIDTSPPSSTDPDLPPPDNDTADDEEPTATDTATTESVPTTPTATDTASTSPPTATDTSGTR